ncbi:hypothetical protein P3T35_004418 [Kitasatospora sp. GP30]|nr:hypothetical protein [Kitasatospora sp. GP30]
MYSFSPGQRAHSLEQAEELAPPFPLADPVVDLAGGQVEGGEHVHHTVVPVVRGPQPTRRTRGPPGLALAGLEVERTEFVHADHPTVGGWRVVELQDPVHLGDEGRVSGGLPRRCRLPGHLALAQDPAQGLPSDGGDNLVFDQVFGKLGQAPGGKGGDAPIGGGRPGDQADALAHLVTDRLRASPAPFWVQRVEPPLVEGVDDISHVLLADLEQRGDVSHRLPLRRHQHHDCPPEPDRFLRGPADPLQPPALLHAHRPSEHSRTTPHDHLQDQIPKTA